MPQLPDAFFLVMFKILLLNYVKEGFIRVWRGCMVGLFLYTWVHSRSLSYVRNPSRYHFSVYVVGNTCFLIHLRRRSRVYPWGSIAERACDVVNLSEEN